MLLNIVRPSLFTLLAALAATSGAAQAAPCTGVNVGMSSTADVTFAGIASDQCVIANLNSQAGPNGNTSGFSTEFGGGWSLLGKVTSSAGSAMFGGVNYAWTFAQSSGTTGTWSLTTDQNATFDLVFSMHAGGYSGAFLFDNESTLANQLNSDTWQINWLNNGGNRPDYSNLTLFIRDASTVTPIPEPSTYALMFASLGVMAFVVRRRRAAP